jgi:two-component system, OmpR family, response regulator
MSRILVVDDDPHIRELARVFLKGEGFDVFEASDGVEALARLETIRADLVILDIMMPNMDGWELCRQLRAAYDLPLLMLTAKGETSQKIKGFQLGTDDYLVKPFEPLELVARVKALLKRYRIATSQKVQVGDLAMDHSTFEVTVGGVSVTLPLKEFELLYKLASYPGKTLSRDQLIEDVWGYDFEGNERTLDVHVNRLRERFPEGRHGFRIATIRGLGYRMEVVRIEAGRTEVGRTEVGRTEAVRTEGARTDGIRADAARDRDEA